MEYISCALLPLAWVPRVVRFCFRVSYYSASYNTLGVVCMWSDFVWVGIECYNNMVFMFYLDSRAVS